MFKFSAVSQIWKKYIRKLNDWDLLLNKQHSLYPYSWKDEKVPGVLNNPKKKLGKMVQNTSIHAMSPWFATDSYSI